MNVLIPPYGKPTSWDNTVFLGGAIDMGTAADWQQEVIDRNAHHDVTFLNPRRGEWNSDWVQSINNPQFREQVEWELDSIDKAESVFFYLPKNSMGPITLMEIAHVLATKPGSALIVVEHGFHRRGNIEIMAKRVKVPVFSHISVFDTFLDLRCN